MEFQPTGSSLNYCHSLDESDTSKRNSLLRGLVQLDIAKGYRPIGRDTSYEPLAELGQEPTLDNDKCAYKFVRTYWLLVGT